MKKDELFEVLGNIDPEIVEKAGKYQAKKKSPVKWGIWAGFAAAAVVATVGTVIAVNASKRGSSGMTDGKSGKTQAAVVKVMASYPTSNLKDISPEDFAGYAHYEWFEAQLPKIQTTNELAPDMDKYYSSVMAELLKSQDENTVCSPLNTYIAFAMLAEVSDGNSRKQVLDMLGASDMDALRKNVKALWESNYADTPLLKSLLGNSVWLNSSINYNEDTLKRLADQYYASSFQGTPGSAEMDEELRKWTDEHTGKLLTEYTKDMSMDPRTALELVSTIYYKAQWQTLFDPEQTTKETFHGTKKDQTVDMMHMESQLSSIQTDKYTAVSLPLTDSGAMYFYLPKKGVDVNELVADPALLQSLRADEKASYPMVKLSVPKFKVSGKQDLRDMLEKLGVTDVLDPIKANFSALTTAAKDFFLSKADHAAVVEIDEKGVTAAAYTDMAVCGSVMPQETLEFVLDRPFVFVVTGWDGSVLFTGVVRNIE